MNPKDMSTRKLKRVYLRAVKREWRWASRKGSPSYLEVERAEEQAEAGLFVRACADELRHRGWSA
ncbi:hypothetical protein [Microbacterium sp.]|uniref:hypothetical protein n=1 Tax=Microbacterium sp. TaxID=51671 RepID=UPI0039E5628C